MSMPTIGHQAILASAGSGKTFQLTNRCVKLMLLGVDPERILALTFTRKAAGEFFVEIVRKVAHAAADPAFADRLAGEQLGLEGVGSGDFLRLLRKLTSRMHLLSFGTLDSFFVRVLEAFPLEFGFGAGFELIEDAWSLAAAREPVYDRVFDGAGARGLSIDELVNACRQAQLGHEDRAFARLLDDVVGSGHRILLEAPARDLWGDAEVIWPDGSEILQGRCRAGDLDKALAALEAAFAADPPTDKQAAWWDEFMDEARRHVTGRSMPNRLKGLTDKILEAWEKLEGGDAEITVNRGKQAIRPATGAALKEVVRVLTESEYRVRLERTRGIWRLLDAFEHAYHDLVRRRGLLTFDDIPRLLGGRGAQGMAGERRLDLEYRLDGRFDHWLIDEFQDTSREQWRVIANLVDEIIQDPGGDRTYFQVGDTKQSIYGWRGGDPHLFADVCAHYGAALPQVPLSESWRSVPAVLEPVNRIFGGEGRNLRRWFPPGALAAWNWQDHRSAPPLRERSGFSCLLHPAGEAGGPDDDPALDLMLGLLREIDPLRRGLSCAVLVEKNASINQVVDYIRARGGEAMPVGSGARSRVSVDNPVTAGLLALLRFAAHPGDTFAWEHLCMTPIADAARAAMDGRLTREGVVRAVLRAVHERGFEATLREWLAKLVKAGWREDAFSARRVSQLADAARRFDRAGERDLDRFLAFAAELQVAEPPARGVVQVMTVHGSKGLGFDVVVLPRLTERNLTEVRDELRVMRGGRERDRAPQWVLDMPRRALANVDPVLRNCLEDDAAEAGYDALCRLYVAMTRAKRGLYLICPERKKDSSAQDFAAVATAALKGSDEPVETTFDGVPARIVYSAGERRWHESVPLAAEPEAGRSSAPPAAESRSIPLAPPRMATARRPSGDEPARIRGEDLVSPASLEARAFGTAVHEVLARVAWAEDWPRARAERRWRTQDGSGIPDETWELAEALIASGLETTGGWRAALERPNGEPELWREKPFEAVLDGEWVSGVFDRVVIYREANGAPGRAVIYDFKTDRVGEEAGARERAVRYTAQLELYRRALGAMTGLPTGAIGCVLVFVRPGVLVPVEAGAGAAGA